MWPPCRIIPGSRSGVLKDAFGGAEIGLPFRVANATEFWLEVVGCHERSFQKRENMGANVSERREFKMRRSDR
jgi:hypothetical protein